MEQKNMHKDDWHDKAARLAEILVAVALAVMAALVIASWVVGAIVVLGG